MAVFLQYRKTVDDNNYYIVRLINYYTAVDAITVM